MIVSPFVDSFYQLLMLTGPFTMARLLNTNFISFPLD